MGIAMQTDNDTLLCLMSRIRFWTYEPAGKNLSSNSVEVKAPGLEERDRLLFVPADIHPEKLSQCIDIVNTASPWGTVPPTSQPVPIVSDSYERRSLVLTTNLEFSKWGSIFTDDQMAAAMIDRLAHHGHIMLFEGESYRMKNALMRQKAQAKAPTR